MKFVDTNIPDLYIIEPQLYGDTRGYFFESYNHEEFKKNISKVNFVQDNESKSVRGVLRGLHFQCPPFDQSKLVRCIEGEVIDVALDIRKGSPTYGKYFSLSLTGINKKQLFIPKGFAHGFSVISDSAIFAYKVDNFYAPEYDAGIRFNDNDIDIDWGLDENEIKLSKKDSILPFFKDFKSPFIYTQ